MTKWLLGPILCLVADKITLVAGGGAGADGSPAAQAKLGTPFGVDFDSAGNMYIVEYGGHRVRKVDAKGVISTIAGSGEKGDGGDGGPAIKAQFNGPHNLVVAANGDIYIADTFNNRVRKIDAKTGVVSAFAGTGQKGFSGDGGPADKAQCGGIYSIAFDAKAERMLLVDLDNRRIRVVQMKTGVISTAAGNGQRGVPPDGADARQAPLVDPRAVTVDSKNNIYILERGGHALRVVDAAGKIRTVAGTGQKGAAGDGGDAKQAAFNGPKHLCVDRDDSVIIADTENHLIRKFLPRDGKIVRVAGSGKRGTAGVGGPPDQVELDKPHGVTIHPSGALYISDSENNRVLRIGD